MRVHSKELTRGVALCVCWLGPSMLSLPVMEMHVKGHCLESVAKGRADCYEADLLLKGLQTYMVLIGSGSDSQLSENDCS